MASIKTSIQKGLNKLDRFSLRVRVTYVKVEPGTYDAATDTTNDTEIEYEDVPVLLTQLSEKEQALYPPDVMTQKAIIAALDLPVVPAMSDYMMIEGVRWEVKMRKGVPGDPIYVLLIQEP